MKVKKMAWPFKEKTEDEKDRAKRKKEAKTKNIETRAETKRIKAKEREVRAEERKRAMEQREAKAKTNDKLRADGRPTHGISLSLFRRRSKKNLPPRDKKGRFTSAKR